jgi:hypothetical protein
MPLQKNWNVELPEGLLLKNHIVAREILLNIELWRLIEAFMHIEKKKNALARVSTTMPITSPTYTRMQVSVLGIQLHSVTSAGAMVVLVSAVVTSMSVNGVVVSLMAAPSMLEAIPLLTKDLCSSTLVLSRTFKNDFKKQYTTETTGLFTSHSLSQHQVPHITM